MGKKNKEKVLSDNFKDKLTQLKTLDDEELDENINDFKKIDNQYENIEILENKLNEIIETTIKVKDEYLSKSNDLNLRLEKIKDAEAKSKLLTTHLEEQRKELDRDKRDWRKEEEQLRGKSKVDKILILIKMLKDSIIVKNQITESLIENDSVDLSSLNNLQKKITREFGDYEFFVENAKECQSRINDIIKILTLLFKNADSNDINEFENRSYFKARGILKALHIRLNPFDNHIHSKESKPIELMRIFSVLEPTISSLSGLDNESLDTEDYDKVAKSFNEFIIDEKQQFMRTYFEHSYIDVLDQKVVKEIFVKLMTKFVLTPEQVLEQMSKWQNLNKEFLNKFVDFLKIELTPLQKVKIAETEITDMKNKGLI